MCRALFNQSRNLKANFLAQRICQPQRHTARTTASRGIHSWACVNDPSTAHDPITNNGAFASLEIKRM